MTQTLVEEKRNRVGGLHTMTREIPRIKQPDAMPRWLRTPSRAQRQVAPAPADVEQIFELRRKFQFKSRTKALWDWARLSAMGIGYSGVLLAGGILMSKGLIMMFNEVLGEYFYH